MRLTTTDAHTACKRQSQYLKLFSLSPELVPQSLPHNTTSAARQSYIQTQNLRDVRNHHLSFQVGTHKPTHRHAQEHMHVQRVHVHVNTYVHEHSSTPAADGPNSLPRDEATLLEPRFPTNSWTQSSARASVMFLPLGRPQGQCPQGSGLLGGQAPGSPFLSSIPTVDGEKSWHISEVI